MTFAVDIKLDFLLLAGCEDHYVSIGKWHRQLALLKNACSMTARLFTQSESAQIHCQVGNYGMTPRTIVNWLDDMSGGATA